MKITLVTGNLGKVEEVSKYLHMEIDHQELNLEEIQSLDLEEIVQDKAVRAFKKIETPVLVENVSFVFKSLGRLPGPLIKWFQKELSNEGLCRLIDGKDRSCVATVCYGFCDGADVRFFEGSMEGTVSQNPKGDNGFGWSSVFIPDGYTKTYAELTNDEQAKIAMRVKALNKFKDFILNYQK